MPAVSQVLYLQPARSREAHTGLYIMTGQISDQQIKQGRGEELRVVEAFNQEKAIVVA